MTAVHDGVPRGCDAVLCMRSSSDNAMGVVARARSHTVIERISDGRWRVLLDVRGSLPPGWNPSGVARREARDARHLEAGHAGGHRYPRALHVAVRLRPDRLVAGPGLFPDHGHGAGNRHLLGPGPRVGTVAVRLGARPRARPLAGSWSTRPARAEHYSVHLRWCLAHHQ